MKNYVRALRIAGIEVNDGRIATADLARAQRIITKAIAASEQERLSNKEFAKSVEAEFRSRFPNSFIEVSTEGALGSKDVTVWFAFGKDRSEWINGIIDNDPLRVIIDFGHFDNKDGLLVGDKVKVNMLRGRTTVDFDNEDPDRPHLLRSIDHGWKNFTAKPATVLSKLGAYLDRIKAWSLTEDGRRICGRGLKKD